MVMMKKQRFLQILEQRSKFIMANSGFKKESQHQNPEFRHLPVKNYPYMGLDARKPVFGGLRTTKAQTSLSIPGA